MEKLREKNEELAVHLNETKQKLRNTKFSLVEARRENETLIEENLNLRSKVNSYDAKMHHFRGLAATIVRQAEHLSNILEISADNPPVELVASRTQNGMVNSLQPVLLLERVNLQIDDNFGNTNKENVPDPILIKVEGNISLHIMFANFNFPEFFFLVFHFKIKTVEEDEPNIVVDNSPVKIPLAEAASVVPLVEAASVGKYVKKRKSVELPVKVRETRSKSKSKVVGKHHSMIN